MAVQLNSRLDRTYRRLNPGAIVRRLGRDEDWTVLSIDHARGYSGIVTLARRGEKLDVSLNACSADFEMVRGVTDDESAAFIREREASSPPDGITPEVWRRTFAALCEENLLRLGEEPSAYARLARGVLVAYEAQRKRFEREG